MLKISSFIPQVSRNFKLRVQTVRFWQKLRPFSRSSTRKYFAFSLTIFALAGLSGCETHNYGLPTPTTEQGKSVLDLWLFSLYTATALGVIVFAVLFYSMIRHRRRNNELPVQTEGNIALEITYTVIPLIIVTILFFWGLKAQDISVHLSKNPDVVVDVTGYQWNWNFRYPDKNVSVSGGVQSIPDESTYPEMVLPVDRKIRFNLTAADVNHAFFVTDFLTKRDLIPGVRNSIEITPEKTGEYIGHCAEFCGTNHSAMNFRVKVVPQAEFDQWVATHQSTGNSVQAGENSGATTPMSGMDHSQKGAAGA